MEKEDIFDKVISTLKNDPENAYTIAGIMVTTFKVNPKDIKNKPFKDWKEGQPTLYGRIDRCLRRLYREGRIKGRKHEKAMVYWYNPSFQIKYSTSPGGAIVMQQVEE